MFGLLVAGMNPATHHRAFALSCNKALEPYHLCRAWPPIRACENLARPTRPRRGSSIQLGAQRESTEPLAVQLTRAWVERVVIGLGLCPWAAPVHSRGEIAYSHTDADDREGVFAAVLCMLSSMSAGPSPETAFVIAPHFSPVDFYEFNTCVAAIEEYLKAEDLDAEVMVVGFHPHFIFAGEEEDDPGNFVNRSPHPMLHILRQQSVTEAINAQPHDALDVSAANQARLREIGRETLDAWLRPATKDCD